MRNNANNGYSKLSRYAALCTALCAFIIAVLVLYSSPMPGVADQGDFQRVMSVTGLEERVIAEQEAHWFKYVTPEYKMIPLNPVRFLGVIPTTSMIYPITLTRILCRLAGRQYFNTHVLAFIYVIMYIASIYFCIKNIRIKRKATLILFGLLSLFVLMDGNYLVWFNSLYGEPLMIIGLLAFTGSILYYSRHVDDGSCIGFLTLYITSFLFIGSKAQCIPLLPFILLVITRMAIQNKKEHFSFRKKSLKPLIAAILMLVIYSGGIYLQTGKTTGVDTAYNSVFYGILKNSRDPQADLSRLGLPADMAVDAGKHAYLPRSQYKKYIPWSEFTMKEFSEKISNLKLLAFYILQPQRLIEGMEYTASQSFDTGGFLGKYEQSAGPYKYTFSRFTLWSGFRNTILPKRLVFISAFYLLFIVVSIIEFFRRRKKKKEVLQIELLWFIAAVSLLQFPMPYIGNGEADTGKQLFLFNYTFDILFIVATVWVFDRLFLLTGALTKGFKSGIRIGQK